MKKVILFFTLIFLVGFQGNSSAELEAAQLSVGAYCYIVTYPISQGGDGSCYSYETFGAALAEHDLTAPEVSSRYANCLLGCLVDPI